MRRRRSLGRRISVGCGHVIFWECIAGIIAVHFHLLG